MAGDDPIEYAAKYSFYAEWYNEVAEVTKSFLLSFYPHDETLELYDLKYNRMFLRRTKVDGIRLSSLHKGSVVHIFCRQIKVVDYANVWTEKVFQHALQKIFAIIKPDAIRKAGDVIGWLERNGYKLTKMKMGLMSHEAVLQLFNPKKEEPLPPDLIKSLMEVPMIAIEAIGERGLSRWLNAVDPCDPVIAKAEAPDSLRALLGTDAVRNAIHTSCHPIDVVRESQLWFPLDTSKNNLIAPTCQLVNSTCCIIKPHAVHEGLVGEILNFIWESGFFVHAIEMFYLERSEAEEFYEVYRGVVPEFSSMVYELVVGPCVAMELTHIAEPEMSSSYFRQLCGPCDPVTAKKLHPNSLRAKFGSSTVHNAVHCTDLPDDAKLEVEFFFKLLQLK